MAWLLAVLASAWLRPTLQGWIAPRDGQRGPIRRLRAFALIFLPLLLPVLAYAFTAAGEQVTRSLFGSGAVIVLGKRVFVFVAVRRVVRDMVNDPFLKTLGRSIALPIAGLYVLGLLDPIVATLDATRVSLGLINFSVLAIIRAAIAGTTYIRGQESMGVPTRELAAKAFDLAIFVAVGLILLNIMGLDLSALAMLGGAIGVGLGFGLQKIASNFISGIILLLKGQATVGDFVELDGGEAGKIIKMGARVTVLEPPSSPRWAMSVARLGSPRARNRSGRDT